MAVFLCSCRPQPSTTENDVVSDALRVLRQTNVWREDVKKQRAEATKILHDLAPKSEEVVTALTDFLKTSDDPSSTLLAVEALEKMGPYAIRSLDSILAVLEPLKNEKLPALPDWLRDAALSALAEIAPADDRVVDLLFRETRTTLGRSLVALELLRKHADLYDDTLQRRSILEMQIVPSAKPDLIALAASIRQDSPTTLRFILDCLNREDLECRCAVAKALFERPIQRAELVPGLSRVVEALKPDQPPADLPSYPLGFAKFPAPWQEMRLKAISALGKIGPPAQDAVPLLRSFSSHPSYPARLEAAIAIGRITGRFSEPASFLRPLYDREEHLIWLWPDTHITNIAVECPATLPLLAQLLQDTNKHVRFCALVALGATGTNALPVVPSIEPLLNDRSPAVREQATNTLRVIKQGSKL